MLKRSSLDTSILEDWRFGCRRNLAVKGNQRSRNIGDQDNSADREFRNQEAQQSRNFSSQESSVIRESVLPAAIYPTSGKKRWNGTFLLKIVCLSGESIC